MFLTLILALPQEFPRNLDMTSLQRGVNVHLGTLALHTQPSRSMRKEKSEVAVTVSLFSPTALELDRVQKGNTGLLSTDEDFQDGSCRGLNPAQALLRLRPPTLALLSALAKAVLCGPLRRPLVLELRLPFFSTSPTIFASRHCRCRAFLTGPPQAPGRHPAQSSSARSRMLSRE